jgi:hypothetical protein
MERDRRQICRLNIELGSFYYETGMDSKKFQDIEKLMALIETHLSEEGGQVRFEVYGGGLDESLIRANQLGFLKMGLLFLKAAFASQKDGQHDQLDINISPLIHPNSEIHFDWLERSEHINQASIFTQGRIESAKNVKKHEQMVIWGAVIIGLIWGIIMVVFNYK